MRLQRLTNGSWPKLKNLAQMEEMLVKSGITLMNSMLVRRILASWTAPLNGYPDRKSKIKRLLSYKMVDTCAAEFKAQTPYFYSTYDEENEAEQFIERTNTGKKKVIVFGSGPIRIGQGIEFDYCSVSLCMGAERTGL